mgnify:FL=1
MSSQADSLDKHLPFHKRFGFKLSASYILILGIVLLVASLISLHISQTMFARLIRSQFEYSLDITEKLIEQQIQGQETWALHLSDEPKLIQILKTPKIEDITLFLVEHQAVFFHDTSIILLNNQAQVIYHSNDCNCLNNSFLGIDVVNKTVKSKKINSAIITRENHFSFYSVAPVFTSTEDKTVIGYIIVVKIIDHKLLKEFAKVTHLDISIVRDRAIMATTLVYNQAPLVDLPIPYIEYLQLLQHPGQAIQMHFLQQNYFVIAKKLLRMDIGLSGSLMLVKSRTQLEAMQHSLITQLGILALFALAIVFYISVHLSRRLITPIWQLTETSWRIAHGESDVQVNIQREDEIGILANTFNRMLSEIEHKKAAIQKQNATLENTVNEKTLSLRNTLNELQKLTIAVEQSPASIIITDIDANIEYVNPAFERITGYSASEAIGKKPSILKSGHTTEQEYKALWQSLLAGESWHGEFYNRTKDGELYWERAIITPVQDKNKKTTHFLGIKEDITSYKAYEQKLIEQATYDPLTALPNRVLAKDRLDLAISYTSRSKSSGALIFIDLDNFKIVNDTLGHKAGDDLLVEVAKRLKKSVREGDTVARLSGDEFLIILNNLTSTVGAEIVAEKALTELNKPIKLAAQELIISASLGITVFPEDSNDPDKLMQNADSAMYQAKNSGKNMFSFFSAQLNEHAHQRLKIELLLRSALAKNEFSLNYQPLTDAKTQQTIGVEALIRWHNPELGLVSPENFIHIAEELGLIFDIGEWVLQTACTQAKQWLDKGDPMKMAVNISPKQLSQGVKFIQSVKKTLNSSQLPANLLELELTESCLIENPEQSAINLKQLKELGIRLSIDDFGTGYSSLSYLKLFPFDTLKIDRTFMLDVPENKQDSLLTINIIRMAHDLEMDVIGEGVESEAQQLFLKQHHCDFLQGYYFSRPLKSDDLTSFIQQHSK